MLYRVGVGLPAEGYDTAVACQKTDLPPSSEHGTACGGVPHRILQRTVRGKMGHPRFPLTLGPHTLLL